MTRARASLACVIAFVIIAFGSGCRPPPPRPASPSAAASAFDEPTRFQLGRIATAEEIAAWNIDVMPDGEGLPDGSGTVAAGRGLYQEQCQRCHGAEGRGGPFDRLAGRLPEDGFPFAREPRAPRTIGSYWPWATTIFDYTRRAMPLDRPGSLNDDEVYSVTAYLLFLNGLLDEGERLDRNTLPAIEMPARDRFIVDDRRGGDEIR